MKIISTVIIPVVIPAISLATAAVTLLALIVYDRQVHADRTKDFKIMQAQAREIEHLRFINQETEKIIVLYSNAVFQTLRFQ